MGLLLEIFVGIVVGINDGICVGKRVGNGVGFCDGLSVSIPQCNVALPFIEYVF